MAIPEVQADFESNARRSQYGECQMVAASDAWAFFHCTHPLMRPKIVQGVLYSSSSGLGTTPVGPSRAGIIPTMKRYVLRGCVWMPAEDADDHGVMNATGTNHRITCVTTQEGERVLVDWSIGRFGNVPDDLGLFVVADDVVA